jgi:hypothetical protein
MDACSHSSHGRQFTVSAYETRTSGTCLPLSFEDIVQGKLPATPEKYDLVICSFALHLVGDHSAMFSLLYQLSLRAKWMIVLAPHKKPEVSSVRAKTLQAHTDHPITSDRSRKAGAGFIGTSRHGRMAARSCTTGPNRLMTRTRRRRRIKDQATSTGMADWKL